MANARCSQCGTVWDVNNPPASKPKPPDDSTSAKPAAKSKSAAAKKRQTAMVVLASSIFGLFAIAAIGIVLFTGGDDEPEPKPQATEIAEPPKAKGPYRVVDLPESTRRSIYRDYRLTAGSSVEKKVMVPKDSVAAKTLGKTMGALLNREITHMALLNNISEEDILQIVAEGDANEWPPQKKQSKPSDKK
jgi:hypothetical protein